MPDVPPTLTSHLLNLPLEIREEIYYYTLFQPPEPNTPGDWVRVVNAEAAKTITYDTWWGTEQMTRILRVNRQVHDEAEAVLYSRFKFCFPDCTNTELVHRILDPMSAKARNLLRRIRVFYHVRTHTVPRPGLPPPTSERKEHQWKDAFSLLVELLPALREAELAIGFVGMDRPENQRREVVELALRIASPLKHVEKLEVDHLGAFEGRRHETFEDIAERVRNRIF